MPISNQAKKLYTATRQRLEQLGQGTLAVRETEDEKAERIKRARWDYSYFIKTYFPDYATAQTAEFQLEAARKMRQTPHLLAAIQWPRGHAKSMHFGVFVPLWLMINGEMHYMVQFADTLDTVVKRVEPIKLELENNKLLNADFGPFKSGTWSEERFITAQGVVFEGYSLASSIRGMRYKNKRPDYVLGDDLDQDKWVRNPDRVDKYFDVVVSAAMGAMDNARGSRRRFVLVGNLIWPYSIQGRWWEHLGKLQEEGYKIHRSKLAIETNRKPLWPDKYSIAQVDEMVKALPYKQARAEYYNDPVTEGAVFQAQWLRWTDPLPLQEYAAHVIAIDPAFSNRATSDYRAACHWAKTPDGQYHKLAQYLRRDPPGDFAAWVCNYWQQLPDAVRHQLTVLLEDYGFNARGNGYGSAREIFEQTAQRLGIPMPLQPFKPQGKKELRIQNIAYLWEPNWGKVYYIKTLSEDYEYNLAIDQTLTYSPADKNQHDDAVDADATALGFLSKGQARGLRRSNNGKESRRVPRRGRKQSVI